MSEIKMMKILGEKTGRVYVLYSDNYVYQFKGTKCIGYLCSMPAWERTMHKVIN